MLETRHDLHGEFPNDAEILHALKLDNAYFRTLAERYGEVDKEIHRIETEAEPASDNRVEALKKQRLAMLDEVAAMIAERRRQG